MINTITLEDGETLNVPSLIDEMMGVAGQIKRAALALEAPRAILNVEHGIDPLVVAQHFDLNQTEVSLPYLTERLLATLAAADILNDATVRLVDGSARSDRDVRAALKTYYEARAGLAQLPNEAARQAAQQQDGRLG